MISLEKSTPSCELSPIVFESLNQPWPGFMETGSGKIRMSGKFPMVLPSKQLAWWAIRQPVPDPENTGLAEEEFLFRALSLCITGEQTHSRAHSGFLLILATIITNCSA